MTDDKAAWEKLRFTAESAPPAPGVYKFLDASDRVLYVGKAKNLRKRLLSYFTRAHTPRLEAMLRSARKIDFTVLNNEIEALILENNLIKQHRPPFNVLLRDDKTYPYIRVTVSEKWPKVELTRRPSLGNPQDLCFGPFVGAAKASRLLEVIRSFFGVRTCRYSLNKPRSRPCVYHHTGGCLAPCVEGAVSEEEYRSAVNDVVDLLSGRHRKLLTQIEKRMWEAADREDFEVAARLRDMAQAVRAVADAQLAERVGSGDWDAIGASVSSGYACVCLLPYRSGKLLEKREFVFSLSGSGGQDQVVAAFLFNAYGKVVQPAPSVVVRSLDEEEASFLSAYLTSRAGHTVEIIRRARGEQLKAVMLAEQNAAIALKYRTNTWEVDPEDLGRALGLDAPIRFVECYDVSHASGKQTVASRVVWRDGREERRERRVYIIRSVSGPDDFSAMAEAVERSLSRRLASGEKLPDLILLDGGKPQLRAVSPVVERLGVPVVLAALAKPDDRVFLEGKEDPVPLSDASVHRLLQRLRDQAHQLAVSRHRRRRRCESLKTVLLEIEGVGPARARKLLEAFGSVAGVLRASQQDLKAVVGEKLAERIRAELPKLVGVRTEAEGRHL